jgi:hypothetical protein
MAKVSHVVGTLNWQPSVHSGKSPHRRAIFYIGRGLPFTGTKSVGEATKQHLSNTIAR